jgi:hypothetical protein
VRYEADVTPPASAATHFLKRTHEQSLPGSAAFRQISSIFMLHFQRDLCTLKSRSTFEEMVMSINLRVVGVYFQEDIDLPVTPTTSIKDVMDAAQTKFAGFSYETTSRSKTLYVVSNKVSGIAQPYVLRDSDRKRAPPKAGDVIQTWQSYIIRDGKPVPAIRVKPDEFPSFEERIVQDRDSVIWRLVSIVKRD